MLWSKCAKGTFENSYWTKPYKYNQCNYASVQAIKLRTHLQIRTGVKSHKCNQCDFASYQSGNLRKHMKIHRSQTKLELMMMMIIYWAEESNCRTNCFYCVKPDSEYDGSHRAHNTPVQKFHLIKFSFWFWGKRVNVCGRKYYNKCFKFLPASSSLQQQTVFMMSDMIFVLLSF